MAPQSLPAVRSTPRPSSVTRPIAPARTRTPLADLADGQLVTLALNGSSRAFQHLCRRHEPKLRGVIGRRVRNPDDAAELFQETMLSTWAALQSYPAAYPFELWAIGIALNKCRDWGRRRAVRQRGAIHLHELYPETVEPAETALIEAQGASVLHAAISALPDGLRQPLLLTAFEEVSQREVAQRLGLTTKGVETRVRRARIKLKEAIEAI